MRDFRTEYLPVGSIEVVTCQIIYELKVDPRERNHSSFHRLTIGHESILNMHLTFVKR